MSKYIIGGGIAGLIAAFYKHDYKIIADELGGQMAKKGLGPRILEVNENSANLLADLGFDIVNIKVAKIGYRYENRLHNTITPEYRRLYYIKSRNLKDTSEIVVPRSIMSEGKNEIKYFDIKWADLIDRLHIAIKDRIILGKVNKIDLKNKVLELNDKKTKLKFKELISTIPAPIFCKLANIKPEVPFKAEKKVFIIVPANAVDIREYKYVYYPENSLYHRITNLGNNRAAIEYTGNHFKAQTLFNKWKHIAINAKELPDGQIVSGKVPYVPGVEFAGRYAEWNHDIKTDDLVGRFRGCFNDEE